MMEGGALRLDMTRSTTVAHGVFGLTSFFYLHLSAASESSPFSKDTCRDVRRPDSPRDQASQNSPFA